MIDQWFLVELKKEFYIFEFGIKYKAGSFWNGRIRLCRIYNQENKLITTISKNAVFYNFEILERKKVKK